ncbi:MAG TPA: exopolysaccharide biosynthesis polyprenyl glycosylphosphotransferase [Candidatus Dormibacteraeota bacterium]|nr:exopolysaccharide biosynthesis polyprenyl glycosylphosphotransferase [Candidatus Dormibacteraeota bacterium]
MAAMVIPKGSPDPQVSSPARELLERQISTAKPQQKPASFSRSSIAVLVGADICMFLISTYLAASIVQGTESVADTYYVFSHTAIIFIAIWLITFQRLGLYKCTFALSTKDEVYYSAAALCIGVVPQFALFTLWPAVSTSRLMLLLSLGLAVVGVGSVRAALHALRNTVLMPRTECVAVVGCKDRVEAAIHSLNFPASCRVFQIFIDPVEETFSKNVANEATVTSADWFLRAVSHGCQRLLLTELLPPDFIPVLVSVAQRYSMDIAFALPRVVSHAYSLDLRLQGQQALLVPRSLRACTPLAGFLKRLLDIAVATTALAVAAIPMGIIALAIRLVDKGPVLYAQTRVGQFGKPFEMLKFRSMSANAEVESGPVWVRPGDTRVTRLGRFLRRTSLDELPQFINVLRGEMSVVGPRPERPYFVEVFRRTLPRYDERHFVRPGITGWSQLHMARTLQESDIGEKLSYDLFYLENWSLLLDLSLIFKTATEVFFASAR